MRNKGESIIIIIWNASINTKLIVVVHTVKLGRGTWVGGMFE